MNSYKNKINHQLIIIRLGLKHFNLLTKLVDICYTILMIAKIKGKLMEVNGNLGLVETASGLTYEVHLTPTIISQNKLEENINIYTYLQVREDEWRLYGFQTPEELKLFKLLLTVSGVGPKTAFTVICFTNIEEIGEAIKNNDLSLLQKIPGLGKKTALKIIVEIAEKLKKEVELDKLFVTEEDKNALDALVALGYKTGEAHELLSKIPKDLSLEEKIKQALKYKS